MHVFTFVVAEGAVADAPAYAAALRGLGVPATELNRLRVRLSTVSGTRRAILEVGRGTVALTLRPLAPAPDEITVESTPIRDERTRPDILGPDLGWQRYTLATLPTHEGLLIDAHSRVTQAVSAPLVMLAMDGAPRVTVSSHPATTPSIALGGVLEILRERGAAVDEKPRGFRVADLMGSETWVVDPVYGARLVARWREYGTFVRGRLAFDRAGLPTHREVNEARRARAVEA